MQQYKLEQYVSNGIVYFEINKGMYGLPQAGTIANDQLIKILEPHGYQKCPITPGLWQHDERDITFCLIVDDFGIKYTQKDDLDHSLRVLKNAHRHDVPQYRAKVQYTNDEDTLPALDATDTKWVQGVLGTILFYGQAIDSTILPAIGSIATK